MAGRDEPPLVAGSSASTGEQAAASVESERPSTRPALPRRYRRTVVSNYALAAASILVALTVTPVLVRQLGTTQYGIWVLVGTLALYFQLLQFGFGGATIRKVAEFDAKRRHDQLSRAIATSFWILAIPGALALVIGVVLAIMFPVIFDIPADLETAARVLCLLIAADLALAIPTDAFGGTLMALQRYDLQNLTLVTTLLAQAVSWVVILLLGGGLVALGVATVTLGFAGQYWRYRLARRLVPDLSLSPRRFARRLVRPLARLSAWFSIAEIANLINGRVDVIVIGVVVGVPAAGIYAIGQKLAETCVRLVWPLSASYFPHSAALAARNDRSGLRDAVVTGTRITVGLALPLGLIVALLSGPAIDAWIGGGIADDAKIVVVLLAATAVVRALPEASIKVLRGAGNFRLPSLAFAVEAALNLGLSIWLGLRIGIEGVALASLISAATIRLVFSLAYTGRQFSVAMVPLMLRLAREHVVPAAAVAAVGAAFLAAGISGLGPVIGAGASMLALYLGLLAITGMNRAERHKLAIIIRTNRPAEAS